jgi:hypothetical protein
MNLADFTAAALATPNFKRFSDCALTYAKSGVTSIAEVIRISSD